MAQLLLPTLTGSVGVFKGQPVNSQVVSQLHLATPFFNMLQAEGCVVESLGNPAGVVLMTAGNSTIAVTAEADAMSTVGSNTEVMAKFPAFQVLGVYGFSRFVEDNMKKNAYWVDLQAIETAEQTSQQVLYKMEQELLGSTADRGISSLVDNSSTAGGLGPSTYTAWKSCMTSGSVALSTAFLDDQIEQITGNTFGSGEMPTHILMPSSQITNYSQLGNAGSTPLFRNVNPGQQGVRPDLGSMWLPDRAYSGIPIVACPALTTTDVIFFNKNYYQLQVHRPLSVERIGTTNDDRKFATSIVVIPVISKRKAFGRLYGVPA